jgi:hypothetical protein
MRAGPRHRDGDLPLVVGVHAHHGGVGVDGGDDDPTLSAGSLTGTDASFRSVFSVFAADAR